MREDYQRLYARIDLDAVLQNISGIHSVIHKGCKIMGVIKTDGYGHGAIPIAKELDSREEMCGFAVATAEEALILRASGVQKPVLVLSYTFPYSYEKLIENDVQITVFREDMLEQLSKAAASLEKRGCCKKALVHIKVDTGMSRIGVRPDEEGLTFIKKAAAQKGIQVEGIYTHLARADERDQTKAKEQIAKFRDFLELLQKEGISIPLQHCANSAAIIELPEANMDLVRAGIIMYGLWPSDEVRRDVLSLKPALSLHSHIVFCKEIEKGTEVSYGGIFTAKERMRIATVPVGYGDGYPRGLSGSGHVLIRGRKAPVLGRVCMDQFMVDISGIPEAKEGDPVTLIGKDGEEEITMELLGELSGRFNYELACDLGKRIPRVYTKQGKIVGTKDYYGDF